MLDNLFALLSAAAPFGLLVVLWVMAQISRRFGEVTHRPPIYRGFFVAFALLLFPLVVRLLAIGLTDDERASADNMLLHDLPLALGLTLAIIIAWRYWGWLVYAREGQSPMPPRRPE